MSYGQDRSVTVAITASWSTPDTQVLTALHETCDGMDMDLCLTVNCMIW